MKTATVFLGIVLVLAVSIGATVLIDHGELDGLWDDDHLQYLRTDGSRDLLGDMEVIGDRKISFRGSQWVQSPSMNKLLIRSGFSTSFENLGEETMRLTPKVLFFYHSEDPVIKSYLSWAIDNELTIVMEGDSQVTFSDDAFTFRQGANNDVGFTWETASELDFQIDGVPQVTFTDGTIEPVTDDYTHFGTPTKRFKELHISGDLFAGAVHSDNDDGGTMGSISTTNVSVVSGTGATAKLNKLSGLSGGPTNATQWGWKKEYDGITVIWIPVWR